MSDYAVFNEQEIHVADDDTDLLAGTFGSTFDARLAVTEARFNPAGGKAPDMSLQSRLFKTAAGFNLGRGGTLELDLYGCGAGADTATGALPTPEHYKLLRDGLGGGDATQVGGVAGAGATAIALASKTGTSLRGGLSRFGQLKDGRALGQASVWGNPTTGLLVALPAAPSAADVIRACLMVYPKETLGSTKRFRLAWKKTDMAWIAHGAQLAGLVVNISSGALTRLTLEYAIQYWRPVTGVSLPTADVMATRKPHIAAAGSYVLAPLGATTRNIIKAPEIEITLNLGLAPVTGPMGIAHDHTILDWVRTKSSPDAPAGTLRLTAPFDAANGTAWDPDASDANEYQFLATLSAGEGTAATEGRHMALFAPRVRWGGDRPGPRNWNGLASSSLMFELDEGTDTTNDLTQSFLRIGMS